MDALYVVRWRKTHMKQLFVAGVIFASLAAVAQQGPTNSPLLDHLAGKWVMQGSVGKQAVTHELDAQWVNPAPVPALP